MSALTTILFNPLSTITSTGNKTAYGNPTRLKSAKTASTLPFLLSSKLFSHREFVSHKPVSLYERALSRNAMSGDEGVGAFENESFINGSSEFRPYCRANGLESTLNSMSKWLVGALFGAVLLWMHDAKALWVATGQVINSGLSTVLKGVLNQQRPGSNLRSDPGMPSSHAQSIFFFIIFVVVSMFQWLGMNGLTITLSGLALAFGSYLSWLRVSQQLHTISQVLVGAALGSAFCILWLWLWDAIVLRAFISYLWVRITVVLGAAVFCGLFLIHVIQHWVMER